MNILVTMKSYAFKIVTVILIAASLLSMRSDNDRKDMLSHTWVQFAFKRNNETSPSIVDKTTVKTCTFSANGAYEESTYNSGVKISGGYFLNDNQTKIALKLDVLNGQRLPGTNDTAKRYNIIILKLTKDTLIYGQEARYGEKRIYGHDDWYFVRKK
jgi:hypothetical protein